MSHSFCELDRVTKSYGSKRVLEEADLVVRKGENLVILGPSGSGKSVTLRLLVGLERCDTGTIRVDSEDVTEMCETDLYPIRRKIGFLFQGGALFDSLTIAENIAYPLREHHDLDEREIRRIIEEKLALVELEGVEDLHPANLSGGMQKRAALARAMALDPEAIFYDEPTTGLDPPTADTINDLIISLNERFGVTSIIVTHDIHCTMRMAHRVALLWDHRFPLVIDKSDLSGSDYPAIRQFLQASEVSIV